MKNVFTVFLVFVLAFPASAQKLITTINTTNQIEPFSFRYNSTSGTWIYADYDTTLKKSTIITSAGKSKEYDYDMSYNSVFDYAGNVYSYTYNTIAETTYTYYLLRNGQEIATFDYIRDGWAIDNGILYFYAKENNRVFIAAYDTKTGTLSKGKSYEDIYLVNFPQDYYEGEPQGSIGFTKTGEPYYAAIENNEKFLVIGNSEQKHYSDIDWYMMKTDNNGELTYLAKGAGSFYAEKGNTFVVQGLKEYKSFDYVYGPVIFDKDNNPVYTASDSVGEYKYRTRLMTGNTEGKTYNGNIYEYKLTPSGKIAYVVSESRTVSGKSEEIYENFLVLDGKKGKKFSSISNIKFFGSDVPYFTASNSKNKYFIVRDDEIISEKYDNIYDFSLNSDGLAAYVGTNYSNYEKTDSYKNYVHIAGKKYGPYEFISMSDYTSGQYVLTDNKGNFAYVTGKLVNKDEYIYKYKVNSNRGEGTEHDAIDQIKMASGKIVYVGGTMFDKTNYRYRYILYIDNKPVAENYESIMNLEVDTKSGKVTCIGSKDKGFYFMEFKF